MSVRWRTKSQVALGVWRNTGTLLSRCPSKPILVIITPKTQSIRCSEKALVRKNRLGKPQTYHCGADQDAISSEGRVLFLDQHHNASFIRSVRWHTTWKYHVNKSPTVGCAVMASSAAHFLRTAQANTNFNHYVNCSSRGKKKLNLLARGIL